MNETLKLLAEFARAFEQPVGKEPRVPVQSAGVKESLFYFARAMGQVGKRLHEEAARLKDHNGGFLLLRLQLIQEELAELAEAMYQGDTIESLDALCDLQYVIDGTTLYLGLHGVFDDAFQEVHRSNMTKLDKNGKPIRNEAGRVVKSDRYEPPQLGKLLGYPPKESFSEAMTNQGGEGTEHQGCYYQPREPKKEFIHIFQGDLAHAKPLCGAEIPAGTIFHNVPEILNFYKNHCPECMKRMEE